MLQASAAILGRLGEAPWDSPVLLLFFQTAKIKYSVEFATWQESTSILSRLGEAPWDSPVLFNFFAPDEDPVLRRVSCVPGTGKCVDEEGEGGLEPVRR